MAIVASLLVIPLPAGAATGDVEAAATYTACVEGAVPAAGFSDVVAADFFAKAVDCIKYYGITAGTSATTYGSTQNVSRGQMAVFLTKLAALAGVTMPTGADQGFTDIADQSDVFKTAINQAKQLGITAGKSATTYAPNDNVTRWEMAIFIQKTLSLIVPGPGGATLSGKVAVDGTSSSGFTDTGGVIASAFNAIEDIYDLGITAGSGSATTYAPFALVTRGQMAVFLTKALGHTNVRPAGVTMQADPLTKFGAFSPEVVISYRDTAFKPAANVLIDVFQQTSDTGSTPPAPLKSDGTCDTAQVASTSGGLCAINLTDLATNSAGNITVNPAVADGKTVQWWAWTGATGATFDIDTVKPGTVTVKSTAGSTQFLVTTTVPTNASTGAVGNNVKFGSSVVHTFQLAKADGTAVAEADVEVKLQVATWIDGVLNAVATVSQKTDSTGKTAFTLTAADPSSSADNEVWIDINVVSLSGKGIDLSAVPNNTPDLTFDDDAAVTTLATIKSANKYVILASGSGTNSVTVGVWDQYGVGVNNAAVNFGSSAGAASSIDGLNRVTGPDGTVTQGYSYTGAAAAETVTANTAVNDPTVQTLWVLAAAADVVVPATVIQVVDTATDTIVAGLVAWKYDSNDQFNISTGATTFAGFEAALEAGGASNDDVAVNYKFAASGVSVWTLS
jgi:hypothetical protein